MVSLDLYLLILLVNSLFTNLCYWNCNRFWPILRSVLRTFETEIIWVRGQVPERGLFVYQTTPIVSKQVKSTRAWYPLLAARWGATRRVPSGRSLSQSGSSATHAEVPVLKMVAFLSRLGSSFGRFSLCLCDDTKFKFNKRRKSFFR